MDGNRATSTPEKWHPLAKIVVVVWIGFLMLFIALAGIVMLGRYAFAAAHAPLCVTVENRTGQIILVYSVQLKSREEWILNRPADPDIEDRGTWIGAGEKRLVEVAPGPAYYEEDVTVVLITDLQRNVLIEQI